MNINEILKWGSAVVVAVVLGFFANVAGPHNAGAVTNPPSNLDYLELSQGLKLPAGPSVTTVNQGTVLQSLTDGSRVGGQAASVLAAATTIAASSTATVDLQASTIGAPGVALNAVQAGDRVLIQPGTTTPTTFEGLQVLGASASSTNGFITLNLYNGTGQTFTWTAAASTSFAFLDLR